MRIELGFHGAARTVTGSRYLLRAGDRRILIDAGLFQGYKRLRELNWRSSPFPPESIDTALLTHAHIDHAGALPRLVRQGLKAPVYCTSSTLELAELLLVDSAKIHEEDAEYANRKGYSRHDPALPLYTVADAKAALQLLQAVDFDDWLDLGDGITARYHNSGHILGSASIEVRAPSGGPGNEGVTLVFSGDVGRYAMPLHKDPSPLPACDILVCESTYGDRLHDPAPIEEQLLEPLTETFDRGGTVLIPAFAVGRSQQITLILRQLMNDGKLPEVPLHIDSPMAVDATSIYSRHLDEHHLDAELLEDGRTHLFPRKVSLHRSVAQSKKLNDARPPRIIVSPSGMLAGGRVLHHLRRLLPNRRNLVVLAGYQAAGTRGRDLLQGAPTLRIHGSDVPVKAECMSLHGLSAHGDADELLRWLKTTEGAPKRVFITHGEPEAAFTFARRVRRELGWRTRVPDLDEMADVGEIVGG